MNNFVRLLLRLVLGYSMGILLFSAGYKITEVVTWAIIIVFSILINIIIPVKPPNEEKKSEDTNTLPKE